MKHSYRTAALLALSCLAAPLVQAQDLGNGQIQTVLKALGTKLDSNSSTLQGCLTRSSTPQVGASATVTSVQGVSTGTTDSSGCFTATVSSTMYAGFIDALTVTSTPTDRGTAVSACFTVGGVIPTAKVRVALITMPAGTPTVAFYNTDVTTGCVRTGAFNGPYSMSVIYMKAAPSSTPAP